jgi:hypothetical protein
MINYFETAPAFIYQSKKYFWVLPFDCNKLSSGASNNDQLLCANNKLNDLGVKWIDVVPLPDSPLINNGVQDIGVYFFNDSDNKLRIYSVIMSVQTTSVGDVMNIMVQKYGSPSMISPVLFKNPDEQINLLTTETNGTYWGKGNGYSIFAWGSNLAMATYAEKEPTGQYRFPSQGVGSGAYKLLYADSTMANKFFSQRATILASINNQQNEINNNNKKQLEQSL